MTKQELIENIEQYCEANYSEKNALKYGYYFREGYDKNNSYGLTATQFYSKVKELLKSGKLNFDLVIESAKILVKSPKYDIITFGLLLLTKFPKNYTKDLFYEIEKWYEFTINNWAHADALATGILPNFLIQNIITIDDFNTWLASPHKFQRRCVPVAFIKYLKMNKTIDFNPVFKLIEPLVMDKEREVHQGVGWFLREAWKINNAVTEDFLLLWKDKAPRLIIQYATEKMTKEQKTTFKRNV